MNIKFFLNVSFAFCVLIAIGFENAFLNVLLIDISIIYFYISFMPKYVFHPNNIIFAFSFLYVVLPSSIQLFYDYFEIPYLLPWGALYDWFSYEQNTYYSVFLIFIVFYFSFYIFNQNDVAPVKVIYRVNLSFLFFLLVFTVFMLMVYLQLTGGVVRWVVSYKEAFLLGRSGYGFINFFILFLVNLLVFFLGLYFYGEKGSAKRTVLIISLFLIIFASLLQGLKSRVIILLIIFFFPYLLKLRLNGFKLLLLGSLFFVVLFVGNYIRSDGYYNSFSFFIEYMMTYFNVYDLHNMIVTRSEPSIFDTVHHIFVKPALALGILPQGSDFDISVMLTKKYFPSDWNEMKATQQWPLVTELYYNYYSFLFGWFPLLVYSYFLSSLYKKVKRGRIALSLIFILEFFRLFTVQRGVLIPWQMPVYLFYYLIIYIVTIYVVEVKPIEASSRENEKNI